jgi:hypothetical protein
MPNPLNNQHWLQEVSQNGLLLQDAPEALYKNREVVLAAVRQNGMALAFLPDELKADKEIVSASVSAFGSAIRLASPVLRADKSVAMLAVKNSTQAFRFISKALQSDTDIIILARKTRLANSPDSNSLKRRSESSSPSADQENALGAKPNQRVHFNQTPQFFAIPNRSEIHQAEVRESEETAQPAAPIKKSRTMTDLLAMIPTIKR